MQTYNALAQMMIPMKGKTRIWRKKERDFLSFKKKSHRRLRLYMTNCDPFFNTPRLNPPRGQG